MSEALETLKSIIRKKLPEAEVQALIAEFTLASGQGAVTISGDATGAVTVTGTQNIVGDNNSVVINQGTDPGELATVLRSLLREMQQTGSTPEISPEDLRLATLAFLQEISSKFKETRLFHTKQPIILKDQYVPIQVTLEPHRRDIEALRGYWETEAELKRAYALKGGEEGLERQQLDWLELKQKHQRLMVLADPGMGKSTLLRMEGGTTAQQEWQRLESHPTAIDTTILPLFLRLSELAKDTEELIVAIPKLIQRDYPQATLAILPLLIEKLKTGQCLLLLDALDEVPEGERLELKNRLDRFVGNYPCSVFCTSRIVGYYGNFLAGGVEAEIVPFREQQIEQYVTTWFTNAAGYLSDPSVSVPVLLGELRSKPQVQGLVQNPLLLALICSLYQEQGLTLPSRRVQVYEKSVEYMLEHWSKTQRSRFPGKTKAKTRLLEALAYHFSCEDQEVFDWDDLYDWMENYLDTDAPRDLREVKTEELIAELSEADGILQKLNPGSKQYVFLHRTFQEYFTACYLSRAKDVVVLAKEHIWQYDWHETISLMAGLMKEPQPLLQAIVAEQDDIFHTQLLLAGRCLAECEGLVSSQQPFAIDIIDQIYQIWEVHHDWKFIDPLVIAITKVHSYLLEKIQYSLIQPIPDLPRNKWGFWQQTPLQSRALEILGQVGNPAVVPQIVASLSQPNCDWRVAINALEAIGGSESRRALMSAHNGDNYVGRRRVRAWEEANIDDIILGLTNRNTTRLGRMQGAWMLGKSRDPRAWDILMPMLHDATEEARLRGNVARGLGHLGDTRACAALINALVEEKEIADQAAWALGQLRCPDGNSALLLTAQDPNAPAVRAAIAALADCGEVQAVDVLIRISTDPNNPHQTDALNALIRIGDPSGTTIAVELLVAKLTQPDKDLSVHQILTKLAEIQTSQALQALTTILMGEQQAWRGIAATVLKEVNNPNIQQTLATLYNDENKDVRQCGIQALMQLDPQKGHTQLISALYDKDLQTWAMKRLRGLHCPEVTTALIAILQDQSVNCEIRQWAVTELSVDHDSRAISSLIAVLQNSDEDLQLRQHVVESLSSFNVSPVIQELLNALTHYDASIAQCAAHSLARLNRPECIDILVAEFNEGKGNNFTGNTIIESLAQMSHPKATMALLTAISHTNGNIVNQAAIALERVGTSETLQQLIDRPDIDIFTPAIFHLARTLAIRFGKAELPFIPVYPEMVMGKRTGSSD